MPLKHLALTCLKVAAKVAIQPMLETSTAVSKIRDLEAADKILSDIAEVLYRHINQ